MAWSTPKTDWVSADVIGNTDLNRIEGNIAEVANVSGTDAQLAQNATGTLDIGETATTVNVGETATTVNLGGGSSSFNLQGSIINPSFSGTLNHSDIRGAYTTGATNGTILIPAGMVFVRADPGSDNVLELEIKDNTDAWRGLGRTTNTQGDIITTILSDGTNARIRITNSGTDNYSYYFMVIGG